MRPLTLLLLLLPGCTFDMPTVSSAVRKCEAYQDIFAVAAARCNGTSIIKLSCSKLTYFDVDLPGCKRAIEEMTCEDASMTKGDIPACWYTAI